ncbi:DUF3231 family protein [Paenibacillus glycanilyticus]|uniref:DUF3231 family protein n=1 Tax=Paenibacillus glycanilyticus TaxID=126569 RepID=UPI003EB850F1
MLLQFKYIRGGPCKNYKTKTRAKQKEICLNKLTSAEIGKLWITYMGNSMARCVLRYFLQNVDDANIRDVLNEALQLADRFTRTVDNIFTQEGHPVPIGYTEEDVNVEAPRLYADEFYLHYLKYTSKAGISIYGIAVPFMSRPDVREFFTDCLVGNYVEDGANTMIDLGWMEQPPQAADRNALAKG